MILELFSFIMLLSIVLITLGFVFKDWSAFALIGFTILFILSIIILNSGLQYQSGATVSSTYGYDSNSSLNATTQQITYQYTNWQDSNTHEVGYLLSIVGLVGGVFVLWTTTGGLKKV